jgi:hypothetical protein
MFIDDMKEMLTQPKVTMANMVEKASETESVAV